MLLKNIFTRLYFYRLYYRYAHKGWSVISKAPKYLNLALPDYSVIYILASFFTYDRVFITGKLPIASYVSLVVYDTLGLPYSYIHLTPENCDKNLNFNISINDTLRIPKSLLFCIILRVYEPDNKNFAFPTIFVNHFKIQNILIKKIYDNTVQIQNDIKMIITKKLDLSIVPNAKFFNPILTKKIGLFINPDAIYLVGSPSVKNKVILIKGKLPTYNSYPKISYIGFMACNLTTTETDSCVGWKELPNEYKIYVAFSKRDAKRFGYNSQNHHLLLWSLKNEKPIIVYRQVQVQHTNIFYMDSSDWKDAKNIMGHYYPKIIHF